MKGYTAALASGEAIHYVDRKRWFWMLSVAWPLKPLVGILLHAVTGNEAWLLLPLFTGYVVAPIVDAVLGEDRNNPPEEVVPQLDRDFFYRFLTYAVVPLHFITLIGAAWWAGTQDRPRCGRRYRQRSRYQYRTRARAQEIETRTMAGENRSGRPRLRPFLDRTQPRSPSRCVDARRSCQRSHGRKHLSLRHARDSRRILPCLGNWHADNQILQSLCLAAVLQLGLIILFGWKMIPFLLVHNVFAWWQLTSANYIEHYGLLRLQDKDGKYERCQPHHSWNSNHIFSNLVLFHLERHSDHHAHPLRRYQSLRHFEDLPTLPNGYFGTYLLAYVPWLWYRVMDRKLLALPHIDGDLERINIDPRMKEKLQRKYKKTAQHA
jgi:alkane 1-monooxygenase